MEYQGHPTKAHWNVALWIGSDEPLYRLAMDTLRREPNTLIAARKMVDMLPNSTPDGVRYTVTTVRHALRCLKD